MEAGLVKQLTDILYQEKDIYDTLSNISSNKTDLITGGKVTELENLVKIEQSLIIKISKVENQREQVVEKICMQLGKKAEDITISEIISILRAEDSVDLRAWQGKMAITMKNLKASNDLNAKLLKNSLEYIDFSLNVMTNEGTGPNNYGSSGNSGDTKKRNLFDVKR